MYKLFLTLRYLSRRRIALFAIVSVWLCVAMVLIVISVMGGFLDMIQERTRGLLSDLIIETGSLQGFPYYQEFIDELYARLPGQVVKATPAIYNYGILRVPENNYTKPVQVVGIRLDEYVQVNTFAQGLYYDRYYPGSTTLAPQGRPVSGIDEQGRLALPEDLEAAFRRYLESHPDSKTRDLDEPSIYSPDGVGWYRFAEDSGPPRYVGKELPGIIIGIDLIAERKKDGTYDRFLPRGCDIVLTLLPLTEAGQVTGEGSVTTAMRYVDDSYTRVYEIDKIAAYVDFDFLQRTLRMDSQERIDGTFTPPRASQILVKIGDGLDANKVKTEVEAVWAAFYARLDPKLTDTDRELLSHMDVDTWQERQQVYIRAVEKEKVLVVILFGVISLVAVVLVGCIFYMIVTQKTRDIGIIKAVGASARGVAAVFIGYAAAIGVVGSILGTVSGVVFVRYINELQDFLARLNPNLRVWSPDVYAFDRIPNTVKPPEVAAIVLIAVMASMLGAVIPAVFAARVWPVKTLRYE
jgi:lipoprotein-releasing system permease protein